MTKDALLKSSIREFQDDKNSALLIAYNKITTDQGFSYIIENKSCEKINCAIHFDVAYEYKEDKGPIRNVDIEISTRKKLKNDTNYLCKYQDLIIFINRYDGYNETMGQYLYKAKALPRDKLKLLENLENKIYGYSLFDKLSKLKDFVILPKYLSQKTNFNENVVLYESLGNEPLTLLNNNLNELSQVLIEDVEFILVNFTRLDVMRFIKSIEDLSIEKQEFGFSSNYKIDEINDIDTYAVLKGITYKINLKLCYNIAMEYKQNEKYINTVIFKMKDAKNVS